jgi:hypothetical protein
MILSVFLPLHRKLLSNVLQEPKRLQVVEVEAFLPRNSPLVGVNKSLKKGSKLRALE